MGHLALHHLRSSQPDPHRRGNVLPRAGMGPGSTVGARNGGSRMIGRRLPQLFFALSALALVILIAALWKASTPEWKKYQRQFRALEAQGEPNAVTKAAVLATPPQ